MRPIAQEYLEGPEAAIVASHASGNQGFVLPFNFFPCFPPPPRYAQWVLKRRCILYLLRAAAPTAAGVKEDQEGNKEDPEDRFNEKAGKVVMSIARRSDTLSDDLQDMFGTEQRTDKLEGRVMKFLDRQLQAYGPHRCHQIILFLLVDMMEIDHQEADAFIKLLSLSELVGFGCSLLSPTGGFEFAAATKLVKSKKQRFELPVPIDLLKPLHDHGTMLLDFSKPHPTVSQVNPMCRSCRKHGPGF